MFMSEQKEVILHLGIRSLTVTQPSVNVLNTNELHPIINS